MNKRINKIIEIVIIFILSFVFSMIYHELTNDDVWNYGFAYNIANGLIPYRDFNMVTTPLFPILESIIFKLISKNIIVHFLIGAVINTSIFTYLKKITPRSYYIPFAILLIFSSPTYNLLCLLFLLIILDLEDNNRNDYLVGVALGLTFLTKQSIGIYLCIPTLFTKDIKKIIKRIIGFLIPNMFFLIYLIKNKALYNFIDYGFLGIGEFGDNNRLIVIASLVILTISIIYLIYKYIKTKDRIIIYLLCFFGMSYPITDPYHVMIPFIPTLAYFFKNLKLNKNIISITFIAYVLGMSMSNLYFYSNNYTLPNATNNFKYCKILDDSVEQIRIVADYVKNSDKNTYIIDHNGYLIKLELGMPIGNYDFFLTGNLGKNGSQRIATDFDKKCSAENCTFILNNYAYETSEHSQYNKYLHKYIIDNYQYKEDVSVLTVYTNH